MGRPKLDASTCAKCGGEKVRGRNGWRCPPCDRERYRTWVAANRESHNAKALERNRRYTTRLTACSFDGCNAEPRPRGTSCWKHYLAARRTKIGVETRQTQERVALANHRLRMSDETSAAEVVASNPELRRLVESQRYELRRDQRVRSVASVSLDALLWGRDDDTLHDVFDSRGGRWSDPTGDAALAHLEPCRALEEPAWARCVGCSSGSADGLV